MKISDPATLVITRVSLILSVLGIALVLGLDMLFLGFALVALGSAGFLVIDVSKQRKFEAILAAYCIFASLLLLRHIP